MENSSCQVTIKILRNKSSQMLTQQFYHEIEILKLVKNHGNIMEFIGVTDAENEGDVCSVFNETTSTDLLEYLHNLRGSSAELPSVIIQECTKELLKFSLDIVTGLTFLHESAKIGNFYYSSVCNNEGENEKNKERPIEQFIAWMPPELLKNTVKSFECDMWSFGVLLWEMFSLGDVPFDRNDNETKARQIIQGKRLQKPDGCNSRIFKVMSRCWIDFPSQRPSADQLVLEFNNLLTYTDLMWDSNTCMHFNFENSISHKGTNRTFFEHKKRGLDFLKSIDGKSYQVTALLFSPKIETKLYFKWKLMEQNNR
ncbi:hypothetical protein KUTeg_012422 [Tegillarca granosa]|uniref:Protein kinase domain-containing protein n=1 Tax=Tegillarca granosa TaxID=220873 RepID=A0ABQ9F3T5_TEGGR|nr:hypothetical protein KUTeg_012422 [Tegillarca granosa]